MLYLTMAIITALAMAGVIGVQTYDDDLEDVEYLSIASICVIAGTVWPLTLVILAIGGVFWFVRDFMKKSKVQLPEGDSE